MIAQNHGIFTVQRINISCDHHQCEISLVLQNLALIGSKVYNDTAEGIALFFRSLIINKLIGEW